MSEDQEEWVVGESELSLEVKKWKAKAEAAEAKLERVTSESRHENDVRRQNAEMIKRVRSITVEEIEKALQYWMDEEPEVNDLAPYIHRLITERMEGK